MCGLGILCSLSQARSLRHKGEASCLSLNNGENGGGNSDPGLSAFQVHPEFALGSDA